MPQVLLVDDEEPLRASLTFTLRREGYTVHCAADGPSAVDLARLHAPDIVLLDLMLPGMDGLEVCRRIRGFSDVPIVMLTAKDQEADKIHGLETGADDYVTKPFSTRELLARMKTVMRRRQTVVRLAQEDRELLTRMEQLVRRYADAPIGGDGELSRLEEPADYPVPTAVLRAGPVSMNLNRHEVRRDGEVIFLSPKEYHLLRELLTHQGKALTREQLIGAVWGDDFMGDPKTLDVHIRWLREKIEDDPSEPRRILTVRGVGYRYE